MTHAPSLWTQTHIQDTGQFHIRLCVSFARRWSRYISKGERATEQDNQVVFAVVSKAIDIIAIVFHFCHSELALLRPSSIIRLAQNICWARAHEWITQWNCFWPNHTLMDDTHNRVRPFGELNSFGASAICKSPEWSNCSCTRTIAVDSNSNGKSNGLWLIHCHFVTITIEPTEQMTKTKHIFFSRTVKTNVDAHRLNSSEHFHLCTSRLQLQSLSVANR